MRSLGRNCLQEIAESLNEKYCLTTEWQISALEDHAIVYGQGPNREQKRFHFDEETDVEACLKIENIAWSGAMAIGRMRELDMLGQDPANPPLWSWVTTPFLLEAIKFLKMQNSRLANHELHESNGIITTKGNYKLITRNGMNQLYHFTSYNKDKTLEALEITGFSIPDAIGSVSIGKSLDSILVMEGMDLSRTIIDEIDCSGPRVLGYPLASGPFSTIYMTSRLVRFEDPPEGVEIDPTNAWLTEAIGRHPASLSQ